MRRTDNARIIDTAQHPLQKSALVDGPVVRIKRQRDDPEAACIETQHRKLLGKLPVAYTCGPVLPSFSQHGPHHPDTPTAAGPHR